MTTRTRYGAVALSIALLLSVAVAGAGASNHISIEASATEAEAGGTTTVTATFANSGNDTGAIVEITSMPDGWEIQNRSNDGGVWNADERKWLFQQVESGGEVQPSVTLSIPSDASGEFEIGFRGTDGETNVTATATVSLATETTAMAMETTAMAEETTAMDGGEGEETEASGGGAPGFGPVAALVALVALALLAVRRQ